jgi:hypothetical protein
MPPTPSDLQNHLAFEVHWLVYAAVRFRDVGGSDRVAFQDSALLHARNLLELTGPGRPKHGWRAIDFGGPAQSPDEQWKGWSALINSKVAHLGEGRLEAPPWPVPEDDERCVAMSNYLLHRLITVAAGCRDPFSTIAAMIATLGRQYLGHPAPETIKPLADLVG